ncbi:hypothetical protein CLF_112065, partial [Clonorchis sinensis]
MLTEAYLLLPVALPGAAILQFCWHACWLQLMMPSWLSWLDFHRCCPVYVFFLNGRTSTSNEGQANPKVSREPSFSRSDP